MVLPGGGGSPLSTGAVDDIQKQRRLLTGSRLPSRRPKTRFGQKFESASNKDRWIEKLKELRAKKQIQQELAQQKRLQERARQISLRDLDKDLAAKEKAAAAKRFREVERKTQPDIPTFKAKPPDRFKNPFVDAFPDEGARLLAQQTLDKLPSGVRALITMAFDEKGALPDKSFSEGLQQRLAGARQGNVVDLIEVTTNPKLLEELTDVGKNVLGVQAKAAERQRMFFEQRLRREFVPVPASERLNREQVINEVSPTVRSLTQRERGARAASLGISVDEYNSLTPEQRAERAGVAGAELVGPQLIEETLGASEVLETQRTYIEKLKGDFYPGREDEIEVTWNDSVDQLIFELPGAPPRGFPLPSKLVEQVHGTDTAENFALRGFSALPEDSPLHLPSLSEGTLRILSDTAQLIASPFLDQDPGLTQREVPLGEPGAQVEPNVGETRLRLIGSLTSDFLRDNPGSSQVVVKKAVVEYVNVLISDEKRKFTEAGLSEKSADVLVFASLRMQELMEEELEKTGGDKTQALTSADFQLNQEIGVALNEAIKELEDVDKPKGGFIRAVLGPLVKPGTNLAKNTIAVLGGVQDATNLGLRIAADPKAAIEGNIQAREEAIESGFGQVDVFGGEGGLISGFEATERGRKSIRDSVIKPLLPEFEFDIQLEKMRKSGVPGFQIAHLAIQAIQRDLGAEPTGLPETVTLTDEMTAELLSLVFDPLNLLPVVGFGPEIVRLMAVATRGGARALRATALLSKNPKFLRMADDLLVLAKAEA
ncbi:hypothetical protein LCGC14_1868170, partial [marine sediment metagenome]